jgi:hypothetical protein
VDVDLELESTTVRSALDSFNTSKATAGFLFQGMTSYELRGINFWTSGVYINGNGLFAGDIEDYYGDGSIVFSLESPPFKSFLSEAGGVNVWRVSGGGYVFPLVDSILFPTASVRLTQPTVRDSLSLADALVLVRSSIDESDTADYRIFIYPDYGKTETSAEPRPFPFGRFSSSQRDSLTIEAWELYEAGIRPGPIVIALTRSETIRRKTPDNRPYTLYFNTTDAIHTTFYR